MSNIGPKLPLQNLDAEMSILGGILIDKEIYGVKPTHLTKPDKTTTRTQNFQLKG
jgi:replicative DNA helicase